MQAFTVAGPGNFSSPTGFSTAEGRKEKAKQARAVNLYSLSPFYSLAPSGVTSLTGTAINYTSIRISWSPPRCTYGTISRYIVFFKQSDTAQTSSIISSVGYESVNITVPVAELEYVITRPTPFTNYAIHVQAVGSTDDLLGEIDVEILVQTHSATDDVPTAPPTDTPTESPSSNTVVYLIGDPQAIDTGRVM